MINKTIYLNNDIPEVTLTTYIPEASSEEQKAQKIPAVIVCPGGAYQFLSDREGEPIALRFNSAGYAAFVLKYRVGFDGKAVQPLPLLDLGKAMLYVKQHAFEWRIDNTHISICGFSAGGHLCASYASMWNSVLLKEYYHVCEKELRPYAAILGYPVADTILTEECRYINPTELMNNVNLAMYGVPNPEKKILEKNCPLLQINEKTVPCFIWHTAADELVDVRNSLRFAENLYLHKVPFQLHIYPYGKHGLALSDRTTDCGEWSVREDAAKWFEAMLTFLKVCRSNE